MRRVTTGRLHCSLALSTKSDTLRFYEAARGWLFPQRGGKRQFLKVLTSERGGHELFSDLCDVVRTVAVGKVYVGAPRAPAAVTSALAPRLGPLSRR